MCEECKHTVCARQRPTAIESECERERSSDCDADADSDTVVNRMTAPNNKVISSPNKTSARAPTRKAKAVRAGQQVRTSQRAGLRQCVCETERESAATNSNRFGSKLAALLLYCADWKHCRAVRLQVTTSSVTTERGRERARENERKRGKERESQLRAAAEAEAAAKAALPIDQSKLS